MTDLDPDTALVPIGVCYSLTRQPEHVYLSFPVFNNHICRDG